MSRTAPGVSRATSPSRAGRRERAKAKAKAKAVSRRDATGHLNPRYAADLRAKSRESAEDLHVDRAFLRKSKSREKDSLSEELGAEAVMTMVSKRVVVSARGIVVGGGTAAIAARFAGRVSRRSHRG